MFTFSNNIVHRTLHSRPRALHLINSFDAGGTERQAVELLNRLDEKRFDARLAVLGWRGPLRRQIVERFPYVPEFPLDSFFNANAVKQILRLRATMIAKRISVLHTHDGGVPELIEDGETGFLVPPANSEALAERIEYALSQAGLTGLIAMRGRQFIIERFGMERMVAAVERLYDEIIVGQR
jgi:hypothetical protein